MPRPPKQPMKCDFTDPADIAAWQESVRRRTGDPVPDEFDLGQLFGSLAVSPQACAIANQMGMFVRDAGERENTYTHAQRELVDQVLARDWNMNHVQVMHIKDAISAGVRMEAIKALRYHHEEDLDEEERLLVNFIRRVVTRSVDNETWNAVEQLMGPRGVVEYTVFVLWLQWLFGWIKAINQPEPSDAEIDKLIADLDTGAVAAGDYRERIPCLMHTGHDG